MKSFQGKRHTEAEYINGILEGDRTILSKAITVAESALPEDNMLSEKIINTILPHTGNSLRIGITGVPGVGKSSFIEVFGKQLTATGKKIAILTIDPSSQKTKGSILGDKTRMEELSKDPFAYIRPTASGEKLGGIHSKTREAMLLCEAAGFEIILIETVGVGQSETSVKNLVDFFLLLMLAGAGDELQGIKKGIIEMADAIAITKADGDNITKSEIARKEFTNALHLFPVGENGWSPKVVTCSSLEKTGIAEIITLIDDYVVTMKSNGFFDRNRKQQNVGWMKDAILYSLQSSFYNNEEIKKQLAIIIQEVESGNKEAIIAAKELLAAFYKNNK